MMQPIAKPLLSTRMRESLRSRHVRRGSCCVMWTMRCDCFYLGTAQELPSAAVHQLAVTLIVLTTCRVRLQVLQDPWQGAMGGTPEATQATAHAGNDGPQMIGCPPAAMHALSGLLASAAAQCCRASASTQNQQAPTSGGLLASAAALSAGGIGDPHTVAWSICTQQLQGTVTAHAHCCTVARTCCRVRQELLWITMRKGFMVMLLASVRFVQTLQTDLLGHQQGHWPPSSGPE